LRSSSALFSAETAAWTLTLAADSLASSVATSTSVMADFDDFRFSVVVEIEL